MYMRCGQTHGMIYILRHIPMLRQEVGSGFQTAGDWRGWDRDGTLVLVIKEKDESGSHTQ